MKDRVRLVMENEQLTPAQFADTLDINRAVISHILNGRNNPSLDVVKKILSKFSHINSDWLLLGKEPMYKEGSMLSSSSSSLSGVSQSDLFHQNDSSFDSSHEACRNKQESSVKPSEKYIDYTEIKCVNGFEKCDKKITQIMIYYDDNTYETFFPR